MAAISYPETRTAEPASRPRLVVIAGGRADPARRQPRVVYVRRRLVALALAAMLVAVAAVGLGLARTAPGADDPEPIATRVHVVQPGDTLWSIARELEPTSDPRAVVDRLASLNGGSAVHVGQRLVLG
jgi:hypothetical protein